MKNSLNNTILILSMISIMIPNFLYAQQEEPEKDGEVEDAEILITKDRQLTLPSVEKIFEKARVGNNQITPERRPNIFKPYNYIPIKSIPKFEAKPPLVPKVEGQFRNYVKAGLGNFQSALFSARLFIPTDDNKIIGLNIDHLSFGKGAVDGSNSKSSKSTAGIFAKFLGEKVVLSTLLNFNTSIENFYGHGVLPPATDFITEQQQFNSFSLKMSLEDVNIKDKWAYNIGASFNSISDNFNASENLFEANAEVVYNEHFAIKLEGSTSNYKDVSELSRNNIRLLPTYNFEYNNIRIDAGLSFNFQNDTTTLISSSKFFPYLKASYVLSDKVELFGLIDAGFNTNYYKDIVNDNPFINDQLTVQNEAVDYNIKVGIDSQPLEKLSLRAYLDARSVKNKAIFVNSGIYNSRFDLVYLNRPTTEMTIHISSNYQINERNSLGVNFENTNYSNDLTTSFQLPNITFGFNGSHQIRKKFRVNWSYNTFADIQIVNSDTGAKESISFQSLNLSFSYNVIEKLNLFVDLDNFLNQYNQRYYNYEMRGFQFKIGAFYRF